MSLCCAQTIDMTLFLIQLSVVFRESWHLYFDGSFWQNTMKRELTDKIQDSLASTLFSSFDQHVPGSFPVWKQTFHGLSWVETLATPGKSRPVCTSAAYLLHAWSSSVRNCHPGRSPNVCSKDPHHGLSSHLCNVSFVSSQPPNQKLIKLTWPGYQ